MNAEKELISQQPAEEWYKEMSASGKFNSMFIVCFNGSQEAKTNLRLIEKASKFLDSVLGARNEISDIHVSTLVTEEQISLQISKDSIYDGILNWTFMPYPIYVKVACNFRGTVDSMLDTMLRFFKSKNAFYNEGYNADIMMIRHQPDFNWGWRYTTAYGNINSFIDDAIEIIISDKDENYRRTTIKDIAVQLYDINIWSDKSLEELIHIVSKWADKRRYNALNEDFINVNDLQNDIMCIDSEEPSFFHRCPYNTAIIIMQDNARGEFSQKIMSLAKKSETVFKTLLRGKCFVEIGAYSEETARLTGPDVHVFDEEEIEFMYMQPAETVKKRFGCTKTDTYIWFDMPERFGEFCNVCKALEELIEKAYGAFKSPEEVHIGFIWTKSNEDWFLQSLKCPYVTFSRMHDCSSVFEMDELIGQKEGTYQFIYQNTVGKNLQIEEIEKLEKEYMLRQMRKNKDSR